MFGFQCCFDLTVKPRHHVLTILRGGDALGLAAPVAARGQLRRFAARGQLLDAVRGQLLDLLLLQCLPRAANGQMLLLFPLWLPSPHPALSSLSSQAPPLLAP